MGCSCWFLVIPLDSSSVITDVKNIPATKGTSQPEIQATSQSHQAHEAFLVTRDDKKLGQPILLKFHLLLSNIWMVGFCKNDLLFLILDWISIICLKLLVKSTNIYIFLVICIVCVTNFILSLLIHFRFTFFSREYFPRKRVSWNIFVWNEWNQRHEWGIRCQNSYYTALTKGGTETYFFYIHYFVLDFQ